MRLLLASAAVAAFLANSAAAQDTVNARPSTKTAASDSTVKPTTQDHEIVSPRDAASGLPTGKRMHKPYTLTKEKDTRTYTAGRFSLDVDGKTRAGTATQPAATKNGTLTSADFDKSAAPPQPANGSTIKPATQDNATNTKGTGTTQTVAPSCPAAKAAKKACFKKTDPRV